jgi:hypothetical protein
MNNKKNLFLIHETQKKLIKSAKARFTGPIPENCSAHVPMILKEFCSSKINGL